LPAVAAGFLHSNRSIKSREMRLLWADGIAFFIGVFADSKFRKTLGSVIAHGFQSVLYGLRSDYVCDQRDQHRDDQNHQQHAAVSDGRPRDLQAFPASASALCHD
jgi:hypothetical protein